MGKAKWEYVLIGAAVLLGIVIMAQRQGCSACKERYAAMIGAWPGAGAGGQVVDGVQP